MSINYDNIEAQVNAESKNEVGFRELTSQLTITDLKSGDSLVVPYEHIINKYRYFLEDYIEEKELDEVQYEAFRQNPQVLSEALYGTIHLWHTLLELNNCISRINFNKQKIRYYSPSKVFELINEVRLKNDQENDINIH